MPKSEVITDKQHIDNLLAYSERLDELPVTDLLKEAKQLSGYSKETMLVAALARRLERYILAEKLRCAMKAVCEEAA